jgi:hypothetical protein
VVTATSRHSNFGAAVATDTLQELSHEGSCFGKKDLQELQGRAAAARGVRDLL